jgi:hypothetical protein
MGVLKDIAIAGPVLALLLFLSNAFLGPDATDRPSLTNNRAWIGAELVPAERWLAKDSITTGASWHGEYTAPAQRWVARTAALRVRDVFSQFVPGESDRAS